MIDNKKCDIYHQGFTDSYLGSLLINILVYDDAALENLQLMEIKVYIDRPETPPPPQKKKKKKKKKKSHAPSCSRSHQYNINTTFLWGW